VGCTKKVAQAPPVPPVPKQGVFVLLRDPEGKPGSIVVRNQGGSQNLDQPYQAVRVDSPTVAPSARFMLDESRVSRLFGPALGVLPAPELEFVLYFDVSKDVLNAKAREQIPSILNAIRDRRSSAISITGHTDTTATPAYNYRLGMRRARNVRDALVKQ